MNNYDHSRLIKEMISQPSLLVNAAAIHAQTGLATPFATFDSNVIFSVGKKASGLAFHQHRQVRNR